METVPASLWVWPDTCQRRVADWPNNDGRRFGSEVRHRRRRQGFLRFELRAKCGDLLVLGLYGLTGLVGQARFALFQLYRFLLGSFGLLPGLGGFLAQFFGLGAARAGCLQVFQGGLGRAFGRGCPIGQDVRLGGESLRTLLLGVGLYFLVLRLHRQQHGYRQEHGQRYRQQHIVSLCASLDLGLPLGGTQFPFGAFPFRLFLRQLSTLAFLQEGDGLSVAGSILAGPIGVPAIRTAPAPGPMQIGVRP